MKLLALILAFGFYHYLEKPSPMRSFDWLLRLQLQIRKYVQDNQGSLAISLIIPLLILWIVMTQIFSFADDSILGMMIHALVIYYCLGPETLISLIKNKQSHQPAETKSETQPAEIVSHLTTAALHRWFGVFFWYILFNVYGALFYRMVCFMSLSAQNQDVKEIAGKVLQVIEFPVTILMTLSLALASDFDRIWQHCKQYLNAETIKTLNSQYMYKSMDFAVEQCEIEESEENKDYIVELTTFTVLKRMLVVWLVFSSLLVIFSIG